MKVCLTGATGFLGSYTVAALADRGHEVRCLVRDADRARTLLERRGADRAAYELVVGDMVDAERVIEAVRGCDATIHTAAAIGVTGRGGSIYESNTIGAGNVLVAAALSGHDPVIHVSSVAVFVPPDGPIITPDSPLSSPSTEYGRSKVSSERLARRLQDEGHPITIVYPGGILGPDQPSLDSTLEGIVGARTQGWPKTVGGVCLIDVRDIAAVLAISVEPGRGPRRLMLAGRFFTWYELGDLLDDLTGVRARRVPLPKPVITRFGATLDLLRRVRPISYPLTKDAAEFMTTMVPADDAPTLEALGFTPRPVEESLTDTMRWLVEAGHLPAANAGHLAP